MDMMACLALHNPNGMFALVNWDSRNQSLFVARDRVGIKRLHNHFTDKAILFASERKAIQADTAVTPRDRSLDD